MENWSMVFRGIILHIWKDMHKIWDMRRNWGILFRTHQFHVNWFMKGIQKVVKRMHCIGLFYFVHANM